MSLIKTLLTEITDAKKEALRKIYNKIYYNLTDSDIEKYVSENGVPDQFQKYYHQFFATKDASFELILTLDPTSNNTYTQWLITKGIPSKYTFDARLYKSYISIAQTLAEDAPRIKEYLETFDMMKKKKDFPIKDINQVKTIMDLGKLMKPYITDPSEDMDKFIKEKLELPLYKNSIEIFYEDDNIIVAEPKNEYGGCVLGADSVWCTSWGKYSFKEKLKSRENLFNTYNFNDSDFANRIISFINKNDNNHYQIQLSKKQIMDEDDSPTRVDDFTEFLENISPNAYKWLIDNLKTSNILKNIIYNTKIGYSEEEKDGKIYRKFKDEADFIEDYVPDSRWYVQKIRDGYIDMDYSPDLSSYDRWNSETISKIKEICIENKDEIVSDIEENGDDDITFESVMEDISVKTDFEDFFDEYDFINKFDEIKSCLSQALRFQLETETYDEMFTAIMDTALTNFYKSDTDYKDASDKKLIFYTNNNFLVYVRDKINVLPDEPLTEEKIILGVKILVDQYDEDEEDEYEFIKADEPYYGWGSSGIDNWDDANMYALEELNNL